MQDSYFLKKGHNKKSLNPCWAKGFFYLIQREVLHVLDDFITKF